MDLRSMTKVILKLAGLYYVTLAISGLPSLYIAVHQDEPTRSLAFVSIGSWGFIGSLFILLPGVIVDRVIRIKGLEPEAAAGPAGVLGTGTRLLGCFFALGAIYGVVYGWAINHVFNGSISPDMRPDQQAAALASAVQFVVGLLLWIFGERLVLLLRASRDRA